MALRRRKDEPTEPTDKVTADADEAPDAAAEERAAESAAATGVIGDDDGPFDIDDFDDASVAMVGRHDLGSVLIPEDSGAELVFEVNQQGVPAAVWMLTPNGRYNITAWAAPRTGGLWREVVTEIADSLRKDSAQVSIEEGPWGREIVGVVTNGPEPVVMRFIGVDGSRWMVRGAAVSPLGMADEIAKQTRKALADTVIRRGDTPQPVRAMLPLQPSESLLARLRARAAQMVAAQGQQPVEPPPQPAARRSEQGSAMQQLRTITGG